ncbi:MAG: DnaA/Hda family protein, partial [Desulfovibrionaceae bacterium]|nr:DnaA/Hda family protein [Desulfovibrionaceae bacterium]
MLDSGTFKVWIAPLVVRVEDHTLYVTVPNAYVGNWLESRLAGTLREAAAPVLQCRLDQVQIHIQLAASEQTDAPVHAARLVQQALPQQGELPLGRNLSSVQSLRNSKGWRYSFDDFVVGPSNNVAVAAAQDVCSAGGCVRTLFVNSASGLGKTHLVQAVGLQVSNLQGSRVAYLTAEEFASRFVAAQRGRDVEGFKSRLQELDMLLLEDVHFFQSKEG